MIKVLFFSTASNNVFHVIDSLRYLGTAEVEVLHYDAKWNQACSLAVQSNPQVKQFLQAGRYDLVNIPRERIAADQDMIRKAENFRPDLIVYISAWEGRFVPTDDTLAKLNAMAPTVHMLFDGGDPPWWTDNGPERGDILRYERNKCFTYTVNIDGNRQWPGDHLFTPPPLLRERFPTKASIKGITLLTPIDPRPYEVLPLDFKDRPYPVGYAGNVGGPIRSFLIQRMQQDVRGFALKMRDEDPGSYPNFANFLKYCRVVINIPFSGSNAAKHVKGRVVETGWAGACLLEWRNDATRGWFTPRYEFEEYDGVEDCIEVAKYLADRPGHCAEVAEQLALRVRRDHSPQVFWRKVFDGAKVDLKVRDAA